MKAEVIKAIFFVLSMVGVNIISVSSLLTLGYEAIVDKNTAVMAVFILAVFILGLVGVVLGYLRIIEQKINKLTHVVDCILKKEV